MWKKTPKQTKKKNHKEKPSLITPPVWLVWSNCFVWSCVDNFGPLINGSYQCLAACSASLLQLAWALWRLALLVLLVPSTRCCCDSLLDCRVTKTKKWFPCKGKKPETFYATMDVNGGYHSTTLLFHLLCPPEGKFGSVLFIVIVHSQWET